MILGSQRSLTFVPADIGCKGEIVVMTAQGDQTVLRRITELLGRCGSKSSILPPTELYNEGWMLRLILDWFDRNRDLPHALSFLPKARWYSEALLPSRFLPRQRGDDRAESFTHADGVLGHFTIAPGERGEAKLTPETRQFMVIEAKLVGRRGLEP